MKRFLEFNDVSDYWNTDRPRRKLALLDTVELLFVVVALLGALALGLLAIFAKGQIGNKLWFRELVLIGAILVLLVVSKSLESSIESNWRPRVELVFPYSWRQIEIYLKDNAWVTELKPDSRNPFGFSPHRRLDYTKTPMTVSYCLYVTGIGKVAEIDHENNVKLVGAEGRVLDALLNQAVRLIQQDQGIGAIFEDADFNHTELIRFSHDTFSMMMELQTAPETKYYLIGYFDNKDHILMNDKKAIVVHY